jgi:hypothetical protein
MKLQKERARKNELALRKMSSINRINAARFAHLNIPGNRQIPIQPSRNPL